MMALRYKKVHALSQLFKQSPIQIVIHLTRMVFVSNVRVDFTSMTKDFALKLMIVVKPLVQSAENACNAILDIN